MATMKYYLRIETNVIYRIVNNKKVEVFFPFNYKWTKSIWDIGRVKYDKELFKELTDDELVVHFL